MTIDNGNHLLLSGNHAALDLSAQHRRRGPAGRSSHRGIPFRRSRERRALDAALQRRPAAVVDFRRQAARARNACARLSGAGAAAAAARRARPSARSSPATGALYERLVEPLLLAALNIDPPQGSARARAPRWSARRSPRAARACRPLIARDGLGATFIEPALCVICRQRGAALRLEHQLRAHALRRRERVEALDFGGETIALADDDAVVLAVPPYAAASLLPDLQAPTEFRAIVNAHFRIDAAGRQPPILGVLNGTVEWIFAFPGRVSVTISAGDRLIDDAARRAGEDDLARSRARDRAAGGAAAVADRARAARDLRRDAGAGRQAPGRRNRVAQSRRWPAIGPPPACRRRIEGAIRSGNRAADAHSRGCTMMRRRRSNAQHSTARREALLALPAPGRPLGVRARGRRHDSGRIRAAAALSRRAGRCRARSQDRRLSAPHPGRAWRLAAVPRRRSRHERDA